MLFTSLRTAAFRNLSDREIFIGAKDVFLVGNNGQGKSNFLEALYFCAYASSFRTVHDNEITRNSEKDFSAQVKISESINDEILVKFENKKKSIFINGKPAEDRKELLLIAPSIVFCHEDMEFVSGTPEKRRWFFDQTLSLYDPVYLDDLRRYKKILKTRNTVLRDTSLNKFTGNPGSVLDALDPQFAVYGLRIMKKREKAVQDFSNLFGNLYEEVSGITGITVRYVHSWKTTSYDQAAEKEIIFNLQERRAQEMAAGISLSGPHRDRYIYSHNGFDFTVNASTGQKRLLALLLRAAQARRFSEMTGLNPVLLLDDVLLEMDGEKRRRFISVLPSYDQAFYTFLPDEPYQRYQKDDTLVYNVIAGVLT